MGKKTKYSFDEVIGIANDKFHSKYSYENFKFNTMVTKSSITCPKHGGFPNELSFKLLSYKLYSFFSFIYNNILLYIFFYYNIIYINLI